MSVTSLLSLLVIVLLAHYAYIVPNLTLSLIGGTYAALLVLSNIIVYLNPKE